MVENTVAVIGSGGREHAIAYKLAQSSRVGRVLFMPGNGGSYSTDKVENVGVADINSPGEVHSILDENGVDMLVVGPEGPLCEGKGLVNGLNELGFTRVIGPGKDAANLEASKIHSYRVAQRNGTPQAASLLSTDFGGIDNLENMIKTNPKGMFDAGVVVKMDGLRGGKGVEVFETIEDALHGAADFINTQKWGDFLLAERLIGKERSLFGFVSSNGRVAYIPRLFQDYKRAKDGDEGLNTGGMGVITTDGSGLEDWDIERLSSTFLEPVAQGYGAGILYAGLMMTQDGPKLIEYNVRGGDPEWQLAMLLMQNDLYTTFDKMLKGQSVNLEFSDYGAINVVLAANGYPGDSSHAQGSIIGGLEGDLLPGVSIFHGGTKFDGTNCVVDGTRVVHVCAIGPNDRKRMTQEIVYQQVASINDETSLLNNGRKVFDSRSDIGWIPKED